jgi:hypothetical protein
MMGLQRCHDQTISIEKGPWHMLALSHPLAKTEHFGRQWASSCSGKQGVHPPDVNRLLLACRSAFDWDNAGFSCSKTMGISNLSLSLCNGHHHPNSLQLTNGKEEANNTSESV